MYFLSDLDNIDLNIVMAPQNTGKINDKNKQNA